jgi:hypothetical protein
MMNIIITSTAAFITGSFDIALTAAPVFHPHSCALAPLGVAA